MKTSVTRALTFFATASAILLHAENGVAADTHVIVGTQDVTWTYNGQESTSAKPLLVDDLKVGDIIDVQIDPGDIPHGFFTVKEKKPALELVWVCGKDKPGAAVLHEIDCGPASQFNVKYVGSMHLEVMDGFTEAEFWCKVHGEIMAGTLKLKM